MVWVKSNNPYDEWAAFMLQYMRKTLHSTACVHLEKWHAIILWRSMRRRGIQVLLKSNYWFIWLKCWNNFFFTPEGTRAFCHACKVSMICDALFFPPPVSVSAFGKEPAMLQWWGIVLCWSQSALEVPSTKHLSQSCNSPGGTHPLLLSTRMHVHLPILVEKINLWFTS